MNQSVPEWFLPTVAALLPPAKPDELKCTPLPGGGNNRVYRIDHGNEAYLAKWYYSAADDARDRLRNEWDFSSFAWEQGLRNLPRPIGCEPQQRVAVFDFLAGEPVRSGAVGGEHVHQAIKFLLELNRHREEPAAKRLPIASEACFSITSHLECVSRRVERLQCHLGTTDLSADVDEFIRGTLAESWRRVAEDAGRQSQQLKWDSAAVLDQADRIVSPSDFGFHNALADAQAKLQFFDFEYAGWDDPAKTVCDFFAQVQVPVPSEYQSEFVAGLAPLSSDLALRCQLLHPVYLVKWACIVLNPLLRTGRERRLFSGGRDSAITQVQCLERARRVLAAL